MSADAGGGNNGGASNVHAVFAVKRYPFGFIDHGVAEKCSSGLRSCLETSTSSSG